MIISFDLDDTLFVNPQKYETEKPPVFPLNVIFKERLRKNTVSLIRKIQQSGIEVWIYTTSFRSERYIRGLFSCYGIRLDGVVNGYRHSAEIQDGKSEIMPSKYPSKYRISLHIDDDTSVARNGRIYGFRVLIISPDDEKWHEKIYNNILEIRQRNKINTR